MYILEQVRRCQHCDSDMTTAVSGDSYRENPFCDNCFTDRVEAANSRRGPMVRVLVDGLMQLIPAPQISS
jgi:hypothetical protein